MDLQAISIGWEWLEEHIWLFALFLLVTAVGGALLIDWLFGKVFKAMVKVTKSNIDDHVLEQLHGPVRASVILGATLVAVFVFLHEHPWEDTLTRLVYTGLVVMWTLYLIRISRTIFRSLKSRESKREGARQLYPLFDNLIMVLLLAHGGYWLLRVWHINVTPLLASAGIVTAAVALASKDTLANLFGGVSVLVDRPYKLGDWVVLGTGERGKVVDVGIRSTRLLTRDDVLISIPNSLMSTTKIINQSGRVPRFRIRVNVGVGFESDLETVEKLLLDATEGISEIVTSPKPRVRFREIADSTLNYQLLAWLHDPADRGRITHILLTRIVNACRVEGIDLAFPQRVISYRPGPESQTRVWIEKEREEEPEPPPEPEPEEGQKDQGKPG